MSEYFRKPIVKTLMLKGEKGDKGDTGSVLNLKIGGVNLLSGTKDFSGDWINKSYWNVSDEKYNGLTVITNTKNYLGLRKKYSGKAGEKYNFSCYAKKLKNEEISGVFFVVDGSGKNIGVNDVIVPLKRDWVRYNYAITLKADVDFYVSFASYNYESDVVAVCGFKLEREETPSDWTPSLEDVENKFNNIIARLEALEAK